MRLYAAVPVALLSLIACKAKPKPVTMAGYTFTVTGWDAELDKKDHLQIVKFTGAGGKAVCLFQSIDVKVPGQGLEDKLVTKFKGENLQAN